MTGRWIVPWTVGVLSLVALSVGLSGTAWSEVSGRSAPQQETPTVVVEPTLEPRPAYLPRLLRNYDPRLPDPVTSRLEGYVVKLTRDGREACAPGTHVLQSEPEGYPNAVAHAVLYSPHPEPELTLDLFVGEYVEVFGYSSLAPDACASLTWQLLQVESIRRIILPPGGRDDVGPPGHRVGTGP